MTHCAQPIVDMYLALEDSQKKGEQTVRLKTPMIPVKMDWDPEWNAWKFWTLTGYGVTFWDHTDNYMFWNVSLPKGWEIVGGENGVWSYLLDDKKRKRAGIFF